MCTWVGYTGSGKASEITLDMIRRIEWLWSGYYTGLAVIGENGLHYGKVVGDSNVWMNQYSPELFPGACAFFHSRTNSGGGREAAHPYVSPDGRIIIVSQGSPGFFAKESTAAVIAAGNRLLDAGYQFRSATDQYTRKRIVLQDRTEVCFSEIVVCAVHEYYQHCGNPLEAVRRIAVEIPEEAVSGFIFADYPGHLYFSNTSQSLVAGRGPDGIYCATSSLAFPAEVREITQMPFNSVTEMTSQGWRNEELTSRYDIMGEMPSGAEQAFIDWIICHPDSFLPNAVDYALRPLCPEDDGKIYPCAAYAYRILEKLVAAGRLEFHDPGGVMSRLFIRDKVI